MHVPVKVRSLDEEHAAVLPVHAMVEAIKGNAVPLQQIGGRMEDHAAGSSPPRLHRALENEVRSLVHSFVRSTHKQTNKHSLKATRRSINHRHFGITRADTAAFVFI